MKPDSSNHIDSRSRCAVDVERDATPADLKFIELADGMTIPEAQEKNRSATVAAKEKAIKPIVFLGLSLTAGEARRLLDADYRGPIVRGDLDAIAPNRKVVIIDGILDAEQRLDTAEATRALDRGISLFGASSTGALLAAQLGHMGIKGHGQIFHTLCALKQQSRNLDLQDLIAALYMSERFDPITVPLIEPIIYCRQLGYPMEQLAKIAHALCEIPLDLRYWTNIKTVAENEGVILPEAYSSMRAKHRDACELLGEVGDAL